MKIAPNNRISAIVDHEPVGGGEPIGIFESGAILFYLAAYPWVVPHERQRQDMSQFPSLESWFERIKNRAPTQQAYEIAKSINTAPTVDQKSKPILFGQDAKTVV